MTVLAPVDGTERGLEALRTAANLADRLEADIDVVHVTDRRSEENWNLLELLREILEDYSLEAEPRILIEEGADGPGASAAAGERLVAELDAGDYEFVVMGQHSDQSVLERALLGSASSVLLEKADVPVMLV